MISIGQKIAILVFVLCSTVAAILAIEDDDSTIMPRKKLSARPLHYVIRATNLTQTLEFTTSILGTKILRHEENDAPCAITCNGKSSLGAWSKTMVGYAPEDISYAIEITYNYGIDQYKIGDGFVGFTLTVEDVDRATKEAMELGYAAGSSEDGTEGFVIGPDNYRYNLLQQLPSIPAERFLCVTIQSANPTKLGSWYETMLGATFKSISDDQNTVILSFSTDQKTFVDLTIETIWNEQPPNITDYDGRNAFAMPEVQVRTIYSRLVQESPDLIVHTMQELKEKLGTLVIVIIQDPEGHEICLVSEETFNPSVREATDYVGPDWEMRKTLELAVAEAKMNTNLLLPNDKENEL